MTNLVRYLTRPTVSARSSSPLPFQDYVGMVSFNGIARVLPRGDARFDRPAKSRFGVQDTRVIDALIAAAMVHALVDSELEQTPEPMFAVGW